MQALISSPRNALLAGVAIAALCVVLWIVSGGVDRIGLVSVLLRTLHVVAAMIWVGMIWFVNFIQLAAAQQADDQVRGPLMRLIAPRVASTFLHASGVTVLSGLLMLPATGYVLDRWVFPSVVYVGTPRVLMLLTGALAGVAMLGIAHGVIRPALRIVLGETPADIDTIARARVRLATFARINLILSVPVTLLMITASHG